MRVIKTAVERVWREVAQVFLGQFAECLHKRLRIAHVLARKCIRFGTRNGATKSEPTARTKN